MWRWQVLVYGGPFRSVPVLRELTCRKEEMSGNAKTLHLALEAVKRHVTELSIISPDLHFVISVW